MVILIRNEDSLTNFSELSTFWKVLFQNSEQWSNSFSTNQSTKRRNFNCDGWWSGTYSSHEPPAREAPRKKSVLKIASTW